MTATRPARLLLPVLLLLLPSLASAKPDRCLRGDCDSGLGDFRWEDGDIYQGEFQNGQPHGLGIYKVPSSATPRPTKGKRRWAQLYAGEWASGQRVGSGELTFPGDGRGYRGQFMGGKFEGLGIQSWTGEHRKQRGYDEAFPGKFEGGFFNGVWSGAGRMTRGTDRKHPETGSTAMLVDDGVYFKGKLQKDAKGRPDESGAVAAVAAAEAAAVVADGRVEAARAKAKEARALPKHAEL